MYTVYSKPQCPYCDQAKALLKSKGLEFNEIILDVGQPKIEGKTYMTVPDFKAANPNAKTVPQIFLTTEDYELAIGGFGELKQHLST